MTKNSVLQASRKQSLFTALLLLTFIFGAASLASAQTIPTPVTPTDITPPVGSRAFLLGHALVGSQGYICLPNGTGGAAWTVNGRPEATLFTNVFGKDVEIVTHFLSFVTNPNGDAPNPLPFGNATWQSTFDNSRVWAKVVKGIDAGTHPSCPNDGSIQCLLLQSIGTKDGLAGGKFLTKTTFIQRLNTRGGVAPADKCAVAGDVGKQILVPYTADYYFFTGGTN